MASPDETGSLAWQTSRQSLPPEATARWRRPPEPSMKAVVPAGIGRIAEEHHQIRIPDVDRAVDPEGWHAADRLRPDLDDPRLAVGRLQRHQPAARLSAADFRALGPCMEMAAGQEWGCRASTFL